MIWDLQVTLRFRLLAILRLLAVRHRNRFVFLHQLRQFPASVSINAAAYRLARLQPAVDFRRLANVHFSGVHRFATFVFRHRVKRFRLGFNACSRLSNLTFEFDCCLSILGERSVSQRRSLQSVCIPSSIEMTGKSSFKACSGLSGLTFERG
jgi:hypothetical protein